MTGTKLVEATVDMQGLFEDLIALVRKHAGHVSAIETLAVAAHLVGRLAALQDQRVFSVEDVMAVVKANIEAGNKAMIDSAFSRIEGGLQ